MLMIEKSVLGWKGAQSQVEHLEVLGMFNTLLKPLCQRFLLDRRPSGKGTQLIILGAGSESGWVPNTTHISLQKIQHFEEWFANKILLNIQHNSLIVMDNASCHSCHSDPYLSKVE